MSDYIQTLFVFSPGLLKTHSLTKHVNDIVIDNIVENIEAEFFQLFCDRGAPAGATLYLASRDFGRPAKTT